MISTRKKEAELQYIKARQNHTLALQQLNILMGAKPDAPVDSLCEIGTLSQPVNLLSLDEVLGRRADYAGTNVSIAKSEAQRKAALSRYNPQLSMFLATGWDTGITYMGQDVPHTPIAGLNLNIPIFRWGARFKTNRQQKAYIGIQKLQQSYIADNILEELSAATTKLAETEQQVRTARENTALAEETSTWLPSHTMKAKQAWSMCFPHNYHGHRRKPTLSTHTLPQKWQWRNTEKSSANKSRQT